MQKKSLEKVNLNMIDYHIHSDFSVDGVDSIEQICRQAERNSIKEIAITDHVDLDYPVDEVMNFDFKKRGEVIRQARKDHPNLIIRDGIEIGVMDSTKSDYVNLLSTYEFDFILNSVHVVDGLDPYFGEYFQTRSRETGVRQYFEAILSSITEFNTYSVVGHIGYITRFTADNKRPIQYDEYPELFDEILKTVIKHDKGIEINTKGRSITGETLPPRSLLKRYHALGGEIITIGSDAHAFARVGDGISETIQMLKEIGFKAVTCFDRLTPIQISI